MNSWAACASVARFVWTRHRLMLTVCALAYVAVFAAQEVLSAEQVELWLRGLFPLLSFTPVLLPIIMFVSTASTLTLDLADTQSRYPAHFLTLPLSNRQLVLPFMGGALLIAALLWWAGFAITDGHLFMSSRDRSGAPVPSASGLSAVPFLLASGVAWVQVLAWMSFSRRRTRTWNLLAGVIAHFTLVVLIAGSTVSTVAAIAICVLSVGVAFQVAIWGIARARCGDPQIRDVASPEPRVHKRARAASGHFGSPLAAQTWFEWQAHGARHKSPVLVAVPLILALSVTASFTGKWDPSAPPAPAALMAMVGGAGLLISGVFIFVGLVSGPGAASFRSTLSWSQSDDFEMPAFFAALPLSTGDFAWAKLRTAARSTIAFTVLIVLFLIPLTFAFRQQGLWAAVFDVLRDRHGLLEAVLRVTLAPTVLALFFAACSASVVWTALFGRGWRLMSVAVTVLGCALIMWTTGAQSHPEWVAGFGSVLDVLAPWLAALKIGALVWLARRVASRRHYSTSRIASIVAFWAGAVFVVWGMAMRLVPDAPASDVLCTIIIVTPVLGILGAPLALQFNRAR